MPINMQIEFPKLQSENSKLRFENDKLKEDNAALLDENKRLKNKVFIFLKEISLNKLLQEFDDDSNFIGEDENH